jgi:hypothetical protein
VSMFSLRDYGKTTEPVPSYLQLMGALYMGNKPLLHVDRR